MTGQTWTEHSARAWLAGSWSGFALALRGLARSGLPVEWHSGRELPEGFRNLFACPAECLADALRAADHFPGLLVVAIGFAFRDEQPDRGSQHVFCLDSKGLPVDPSTRLYGPDVAYLAAVPPIEQLRPLARMNGLVVPSSLAQ